MTDGRTEPVLELPKAAAAVSAAAPPPTFDFIAFHAAQRPNVVAIVDNERRISWEGLRRDVGQMVAGLRELGIGPGASAAIDIPHFYLHWLTLLAAETIGVTTFSYGAGDTPHVGPVIAAVDLVLCVPGREPSGARRVHPVDRDWLVALAARPLPKTVAAVRLDPDAPRRLVKSSGTTGSPKWMIHNVRVHEFWIDQYRLRAGFGHASRFLITMGFTIESLHNYATACLRMGGVCAYDDRNSVAETLVRHAATHVTLLPHTLIHVLDTLPPNYVKPANLTVFTIGAPVPKAIRRRVIDRLANELIESYGTNEIAAICTVDENGVGTIMPGVRVEVVDEDERPVLGQAGRIRIRSAGSVGSYLGDPEATRRLFRDGWFYPGDLAVMEESQTVRLVGREDDLLNIRGVKIAPGEFEERLRQALPVRDLCLTTTSDGEGVSQVCVVVVPQDPGRLQEIRRALAPLLPSMFGKTSLVAVDAIPRTSMGKIERNRLADLLRRIILRAPTGN